MIPESELESCLNDLASQYPESVIRRLEKGSKIKKNLGCVYIIDDSEIHKRFGDYPKKVIPYLEISNYFTNVNMSLIPSRMGKNEIEFSKVFESKFGECIEKAILVQLFAQQGETAFLISGYIAEKNSEYLGLHGFNIVYNNGKPFLVDLQNPFIDFSDGGKVSLYMAPILGINEGEGEFVVPPEWRNKRAYSVFGCLYAP